MSFLWLSVCFVLCVCVCMKIFKCFYCSVATCFPKTPPHLHPTPPHVVKPILAYTSVQMKSSILKNLLMFLFEHCHHHPNCPVLTQTSDDTALHGLVSQTASTAASCEQVWQRHFITDVVCFTRTNVNTVISTICQYISPIKTAITGTLGVIANKSMWRLNCVKILEHPLIKTFEA